MASGACSSFQVCDSVSGTGSFQNLPDTCTHVSGGTRNRKRKSWEVEDIPVVVHERSSMGKAKEGLKKIVWRRSSRPKKVCEKDDVHTSLFYLFRHRKVFFDSCVTILTDYMVRHTTLVELKVFALIVMFVAMTMWGKNITDAATMAATVVGHSAKVIRHWAYSYIVSIYEMSRITQENITDDDIEHVLSSDRGTASPCPNSLLCDEDFRNKARVCTQ